MILSNYFDSVEIFKTIDKLKKNQSLDDEAKVLLSSLEQQFLLFTCPSCGTPIGAEISPKDYKEAWLKRWSDDLRGLLGIRGDRNE